LITVRCLGHIAMSVGAQEVALDIGESDAAGVVEALRSRSEGTPGFDIYNTLLMVEDGEAFVPATSRRTVKDGDKLVLIPFSHGG
jgi:molybdopterin converting factor small subunit